MSLEGTYDVTCSGNIVGTMTVTDNGPRKLFCLDSEITPEISRLVCLCGEHPVSAGIPVPDGGRLKLCKSFTKTQLKQMGLHSVSSVELIPISVPLTSSSFLQHTTHFETVPTGENSPSVLPDGWKTENDPGSLFRDDIVISACKNVRGALVRSCDDGVSLAVPVSETDGFPLSAFLCFSSPAEINGERYMVFTVKDGSIV